MAGLIGRDVVDGVACHAARVDLNGIHQCAVDVGRDADLDDRGVGAIDLDNGRGVGWGGGGLTGSALLAWLTCVRQ
jgi:hypothetical protein